MTETAIKSPEAEQTRRVNRIPRSTYRLQLRSGFGFAEVGELLDYLDRLGISDLYLSPLFRAREESSHGYDVVDHARLEPSFGDSASLTAMASDVRGRGMGILLDIVPNHMGINDPGNTAWTDVLENGRASRYAHYFDIHWRAAPDERHVKVLIPFLGDSFGSVLESGELQLRYEEGRLQIAYYDRRFPVAPATWPPVLKLALEPQSLEDDVRVELESIITQLEHLPPYEEHDAEATRERYREQSVARRRLAAIAERSGGLRAGIQKAIDTYNGTAGDPRSFDRLEELLDAQHYRLAYWRVAADEINYRRFFDVNDLVAVRVEDPDVFESVHRLTFRLLEDGLVTGLRIDHPDGLLDPQEYFAQLQAGFRVRQAEQDEVPPLYVVAEKILTGDETLPTDWPVSGTTGYDFLNMLSRVLVDDDGVRRLRELYPRLTDVTAPARDVVYQSKLTILNDVMSSELAVLAAQLHRLAKQDRATRDLTQPVLHRALREVIACFPVYRTYVRSEGWDVSAEDQGRVMAAVRWAKRRNPTMPWSVFDFLTAVLLMHFPPSLDEELQAGWRAFALRFQQVTGPVTAKGYEDTTFYRYFPLASLNEVGGEVDAEAVSTGAFHRWMQRRHDDWPCSLSATATHDTKRGEDVRARLDVLSEMPDEWAQQVEQWNEQFAPLLQNIDDDAVPGRNERYLLYQTLVGTWPLGAQSDRQWEDYHTRIAGYMEKAMREAKLRSSWLNPATDYEEAVQKFLHSLLVDWRVDGQLDGLERLVRRIAGPGFVNSLTQVVLKCTLPGVPDFYQGCECWDFRLVDPDNRRPVDYADRTAQLQELERRQSEDPTDLLEQLAGRWEDRLKLYVTWRSLAVRRRWEHLFAAGDYQPLKVDGPLADHLLAFARQRAEASAVVVVPRRVLRLVESERETEHGQQGLVPPHAFCGELWRGNSIELPDGARGWHCAWSDAMVEQSGRVDVAEILRNLPVAILSPQSSN